ncbi:hypothetical protein QFZ97_008492 [Paraburkholderia youngii]
MRGFRDRDRTQAFLASFGPIRQHFALKRHLLRASLYGKHLAARFTTWHEFTEVTQNPFAVFWLVVPPAETLSFYRQRDSAIEGTIYRAIAQSPVWLTGRASGKSGPARDLRWPRRAAARWF